jgi:Kef-type K+ transport system membrane component KefB
VPSESQLLIFWLELLALLLVARALGGLMRRIEQPPVIGELAAGLLLGPSALGTLAPGLQRWLFPPDPVQQSLLAGLAWIGVFLLLVLTGLETDLALIRRLRLAVASVAVGSVSLPFLAGLGLGFLLPGVFAGAAPRPVFALFLGVALAISALPVIAKILSDLDLLRRNFAQVLLAAAMANDVIGWIGLGAVAGLAGSRAAGWEGPPLGLRLLGLVAFLAFAATLGQRGVDRLLRGVRVRGSGVAGGLATALLVAVFAGALSHALGLEAVLGAFIAGIVLARSRFYDAEVFSHLEGITRTFFAPLFFASAGLRVDLSVLRDPEVVRWGARVVGAASASKFLGAWLGSWLAGLPRREGLALGVGLNARGAVEIVVATVGLSLGVLNAHSYALVVLVAIVTSMMTPPLLRAVLRGWSGDAEEQARLAQERLLGGSVLVRPMRVLLPSHGGPNSVLAAHLVDLAWPEGVEVTVLSAGEDVPAADLAKVRAVLAQRPASYEHAERPEPLEAILEHARLGYGAIALGATDERIAGTLVSPVVDQLLAASPLPVVMVRRGVDTDPEGRPRFRRILVPAVGTRTGRAAQEVAYSVARRLDARVLIAHVVTIPSPGQALAYARAERAASGGERAKMAERVVEEAWELARVMGARAETAIRSRLSAPDAILDLARERGVDLLVLAANLRQFSGRPFLGHGVEYLLERSPGAIVVVTVPPGWGGAAPAAR